MLLFHLKYSFHSQDVKFFVLTLWSCRTNGLIRNIRLIAKFITTQPYCPISHEVKTTRKYKINCKIYNDTTILPNISRKKSNQKKKFNQYEVKSSDLLLTFNIFRQPSTWHTIKRICIKLETIDPDICSILIFYKRVWKQFLHHIL